MQLEIGYYNNYVAFEWIPYNQFISIKKIGKNSLMKLYSAIWEDDEHDIRGFGKRAFLKCLYNSQNSVEFVINEV
jgi:hypothetical protein